MPDELIDPGPAAALAALERFVVENDDLLALEERIGRFNIFDALGIVRTEIRHSNFLAWLLDPNESHGQGALFLKAVLMDLLRQTPPALRPFSPIQLDGAELRGVHIRREHRNIDILIECDEPRFVIAIENKVDSGEHSDQLQRYEKIVRDQFPQQKPQFVFLTRDGDPPENDDDAAVWVPYSYKNLHDVLTRVRNSGAGRIGDDVLAFLDHYLSLIGSRFMDNPEIDVLCQRIYKNHRQALDLIFERGRPAGVGMGELIAVVDNDERFRIVKRQRKFTEFMPLAWDSIPPCDSFEGRDRPWIKWFIALEQDRCYASIELGPSSEPAKREQILARLREVEDQFGLRLSRKKVTATYTRLCSKAFIRWDGDHEEMPIDEAVAEFKQLLDEWHSRFEGLPDALRPIVAEWEAQRAKG